MSENTIEIPIVESEYGEIVRESSPVEEKFPWESKDEELTKEEALKEFIQNPEAYDYFLSVLKFKEMDKTWNWSWWAFFGGVWYLFYRKLYGKGVLFLILSLVPIVNAIVGILIGGYSSGFVIDKFNETYNTSSNLPNKEDKVNLFKKVGGTNGFFIFVYVINIILMLVAFSYSDY